MHNLSEHIPFYKTTTFRRGIVHIAVGISIVVISFVLERPLALLLLGLGTFIFVSFDSLRLRFTRFEKLFNGLFRIFLRDYEAVRLTGASCLLAASLVSLTLYGQNIAVLSISFLAIGDPFARFTRERFGKTRLFNKTLEGTIAFLVGGAVAGIVWYTIGLDIHLVVVAIGVAIATLAQVLPLSLDDNISIPLASGGAIWLAECVAKHYC